MHASPPAALRPSLAERRIRIAFAAILLALAILGVASFWSVRQLVRTNEAVEHTLAIEHETAALGWDVARLESEDRALALGGSDEARRAAAEALGSARERAERIDRLVGGAAESSAHTAALRGAIEDKAA